MLKHVFLMAGLLLALWGVTVGVANAQETAAPKTAEPKSAEAEKVDKEIRAQAAAFVTAFKNRDAAAIAAQWAADGVYINEQGQRYEGSKAIETEYATLFKECPADLQMRVEVDSV